MPRPLAILAVMFVTVLFAARLIAPFVIDIAWWKEIGQIDVFWKQFELRFVPFLAGSVICFGVLWLASMRGAKRAGAAFTSDLKRSILTTSGFAAMAIAWMGLPSQTIFSYFAGRDLPSPQGFRDYAFGQSLSFYLFQLPFYKMLAGFAFLISLAALLFYAINYLRAESKTWTVESANQYQKLFSLSNILDLRGVRVGFGLLLLAIAGNLLLSRFDLVYEDHNFLTGIDYVTENYTAPLFLIRAGLLAVAAVLALAGKLKFAGVTAALSLIATIIPSIITAVYVRPNEITLEKPYIERHIKTTRHAYALADQLKEISTPINNQRLNLTAHQTAIKNLRLWDWTAYRDGISQTQSLRQYYVFNDIDVDRYQINGEPRQVMLSARELDIKQLPDAQRQWLNPHLLYTHGYGLVMSDATQITADGQPVNFIQDAPPKVSANDLKLTRPEIYFGERTYEPVYVNSAQAEFNYPQGESNVSSHYQGQGGIPMTGGLRLAAALKYFDRNVMLTSYFTDKTKLLIKRRVDERLQEIAQFITWDDDPYLVLTDAGTLVWIVDGFTATDRYPNAAPVSSRTFNGKVNYVRNSVKATVDAYDGTTRIYVTEPNDPLILAWQNIFPSLFSPLGTMPADLQTHLRHPEALFRVQAAIYRQFHMKDPQAFYNKEDVWEPARTVSGQEERSEPYEPMYIIATLPGESKPELLLTIPFTPRSKDNLIGLMLARCDAPHRGEVVVYELSKQSLVYGPMQIEARINQDQTISKDLTLWNQQGSRVLRGQMVVLPVGESILFVKPIYLQASQARMPQLKKVAIATGDALSYEDTYERALQNLAGTVVPLSDAAGSAKTSATANGNGIAVNPMPTGSAGSAGDERLDRIRQRLVNYRRLMSEGKYAEAGRELEAAETLARPK
jgi:uncharacterized protein